MEAEEINYNSEEFVAAVQAGDTVAQEALVKSYTQILYASCLKHGLGDEAAMEIVQETWATFFAKPENFEGRSNIRTYIYGILQKKILEYFRRKARDQTEELAETVFESQFDEVGAWIQPPVDPERFLLAAEQMDLIEDCLKTLPENQRAAFVMKELSGADTEEICHILGVSSTHLGVLLFRARVKLRACIESRMGKQLDH